MSYDEKEMSEEHYQLLRKVFEDSRLYESFTPHEQFKDTYKKKYRRRGVTRLDRELAGKENGGRAL